jgi:hypothetical protein
MQFQVPTLSLPPLPVGWMTHTHFLFAILCFFFLIYVVISAVLFYHWSAYGMRSPGIAVARTLYIVVSLLLFVVSGMSIYYF